MAVLYIYILFMQN